MTLSKYKFEEIAINCTQKRFPTEEDQPLYIGLEHLDTGNLHVDRWGSPVPLKGEKLIMRKGDVLLGRRNAYLRRAAVAPHDGLFSAHGMVLQPREDVIDKEFFPLFIASDYFFDEANRISVGSLSPTINWKDLRNVEFELPNKEKQRELAKVLWAMDATKRSYQKLLQKTDELVKAQFMDKFVIGNPYPRKQLGEYIEQVRGVSYKPADIRTTLNENSILLLRANNISSGRINHFDVQYVAREKVSGEQIIRLNDILMCASSGSIDHVGKAAICERDAVGETFGAFCKLIRLKGELLPKYIATYFETDEYRKIIMQLACGSNINNLKSEHIDNLMVPIPPKGVQEQFVTFVCQCDKSKFELEQALAELNDTYKKIISENLG